MTQQNELKAIAMRVLQRHRRNSPCNNSATSPQKQCNFANEIRVHKLHAVAAQIIEVSIETGTKPEVGLGFFNALDWQQISDGTYGPNEIRSAVEYAKRIHEHMQSGVRLVEVGELAKIEQ